MMQRRVRKAVIPAAGMGTRVLPASKAMPKEMLPIVDKPAIQYIVEEAAKSGIEEVLIITSRGKSIMEDHFDRAPVLEQKLQESGKVELYRAVIESADLANITYVRQKEQKGLGHAILCAKNFVGDEPFAVLYGDDVIISEEPVCGQLIAAYEKYGKACVGIKEVPASDISRYSSLAVQPLEENIYAIDNMVEKPQTPEEVLSLFSILGRCVLTPDIFEILEHTAPGAGGEIQLTDAMRELALNRGMVGVDYVGKRYDMGNKLGILQAIVEVGVKHAEVGEDFTRYLKAFVETL